MTIRDHLPTLLKHTRKLGQVLDAYVGKSERLAAMFEEADLSAIAQSLKPADLGVRDLTVGERRRIAATLGKTIRENYERRLQVEREDPRIGFSLEAFKGTVLPAEQSIAECRDPVSGLRQLFESETNEAILESNAGELIEQIKDDIEALDPAGSHQDFVDQMFAALAVQTLSLAGPGRQKCNAALQLRRDASANAAEAAKLWHAITTRLEKAASEGAQSSYGTAAAERATRKDRETKERAMATSTGNSNTPIEDAISRLQEGGSGGASVGVATGTTHADFGKALDQQIYASIGVPSLTSEVTLLADKSEIVEKLFNGLDRAIVRDEWEEGARFAFNPLKARILAPSTGNNALGAQGVVAETVTLLKPAIIECVERLQAEVCQCSDDEIDDLKADIERGLDLLVRESYSATGIFRHWAEMLLTRICTDVFEIICIYGIRLDDHLVKRMRDARIGSLDAAIQTIIARTPPWIDRDIGYLTRERNEAAVETIITHLLTIWQRIQDLVHHPRGPLTARLLAVVEAIPSSVVDVRSALNLAGVSEVDRNAKFLPELGNLTGIELSRLLDITEALANEYRASLTEDQINKRDIEWFITTFETIAHALPDVNSDVNRNSKLDVAPINKNQYALGARQLAELKQHVTNALALAQQLFKSITDRGPARPRGSKKR